MAEDLCDFPELEFFQEQEIVQPSLWADVEVSLPPRQMQHVSTQTIGPSEEDSITQIRASRDEMYQRIESFCRYKRWHIDRNNVIEFTSPRDPDCSCARVDAVKVKMFNSKNVETVHNAVGPSPPTPSRVERLGVELMAAEQSYRLTTRPLHSANHADILDQRLRNLEGYLDHTNDHDRGSPMEKLKSLELRVLQLEASSPEYLPSSGQLAAEGTSFMGQSQTAGRSVPSNSVHKKAVQTVVMGHPAHGM